MYISVFQSETAHSHPKNHDYLFESEERVCKWLFTGLENHGSKCIVCSPLPGHITSSDDNVCSKSSLFQILFRGITLQVPFSFVEHHSFSFCSPRAQTFHIVFNMRDLGRNCVALDVLCVQATFSSTFSFS